MPEIVLEHITKQFGKPKAMDNLDLVINGRNFVSLLGPSGCGKTTTLRTVTGLETPMEGEIIIGRRAVFSLEKGIDLSSDKRGVGLLFQNYALWPHMTVYRNIAFGLGNLEWEKQGIKERVEGLLDMLKIREYVSRYPAELSSGQQQRVVIAGTLATNPNTLLTDKLLSNLDTKLKMETRTEPKRLHQETKAMSVYVTHDQLEAIALSVRVCLIEKETLQQYNPPLEICDQPDNLFVANLVGNPNINLYTMEAETVDGQVELSSNAFRVNSLPKGGVKLPTGDRVVLGIRPEGIKQTSDNSLKAVVESSLPSGMETILTSRIESQKVAPAIFGSVDFAADSKADLGFDGDQYLLLEAEVGKRLRSGAMRIKE